MATLSACAPSSETVALKPRDQAELLALVRAFEETCKATGTVRSDILDDRDRVLERYGKPATRGSGHGSMNQWWCTPTPLQPTDAGQASVSTAFVSGGKLYFVDPPREEE